MRIMSNEIYQWGLYMIQNMIDSVRAQIYSRVSSPFFGAFILSWIPLNYRFLIIIFSDNPVMNKNALTDALYSGLWYDWHVFRWFIFPISIALFYIYVYPIFSKWFYTYWMERQNDLRNKEREKKD